ncbi:uncharacterized protein LOC108607193 isoform X2 [Drosophila busckii]|uniref:uncharacterized protein LOC108607193 isoform X2 n=1 Tax=Drosophila busckii TaxID=30019 RepID=UPI00083F3EA4|nr:uncharacterized protein LOC108607193 isoform X2 [Drosophila busckii]
MLPQQYCLRWKYHHSNLQTMFSQLLDRGCFCDVTLACEGQLIRAHRVVLCACSTFFDSVLSNYASERDPIIIMKDVTFAEVKCLIEFMYKGEINVEHASLPSLLKTADDLKIKGLAEVTWRDDEDGPPPPVPAAEFHSPARSLAESYAQDMLQQQQQQQHQQAQPRHSTERAEDNVLSRLPALTPLPAAVVDCAAPVVDAYLGPKRKRGRPPLDDTYDVFNVRKLAQYAANLEPAQRAYLESARAYVDEPVGSVALGSPPAACPPKQRQRLRQTEDCQSEDWQEQQPAPQQRQLSPKPGALDIKPELEQAAVARALPLTSAAKKSSEKCSERRERHGKLRHATRRLYAERERSAEKALAAAQEQLAEQQRALPQTVEEIENEHLLANRAESPNAARALALLPSSFAAKFASPGEANEAGYMLNEHGMMMAHDFAPSVVAAAAAAAAVVHASNGGNPTVAAAEPAVDYAEVKLEDYDAAELRLTNEELSEWQDVIKMDDYLAKGRRPQFWEEPFTKRVLDAIKNKRLEMKKAARILGVSYGTLYGRYREVYGCLKHPYSGTSFRNSIGLSASSPATQLAVQSRFDLSFRSSNVLPTQLG